MGKANHDPLFLVRPMVDMMQRNFHTRYRPGKELPLDESTCPFKGRIHFKCYNPEKPTSSILNFLWSVNLALATFVALKFIQEMHLASHRVIHRNYRMHQKLLALSFLSFLYLFLKYYILSFHNIPLDVYINTYTE